LRYELFQLPAVDFDDLLDQAFKQESALKPMSAADFFKLLSAVPVEKALLTVNLSKPS
jgi:hypothetical protein